MSSGSLIRKEFSARAAACFEGVLRGRVAAGDRTISNEAVGDALGIDEKRVRTMREGDAHIYLGDVLALADAPATRAAARELLRTMLALVEGDAPCMRLAPEIRTLALMERAGQLCTIVREANADGVVDGDELQAIAHAATRVAGEAHSLIRESLTPPPSTPGLSKATMRITVPASMRAAGGAR